MPESEPDEEPARRVRVRASGGVRGEGSGGWAKDVVPELESAVFGE